MSSSSPPFIALVVDGQAEAAQIDDFVDRWHEGNGGRHLHDYLGMTGAEYALWLVEPDMLDVIVRARAEKIALPRMVGDVLSQDGAASADVARRERLERWLAEQTARD